MPNPFEKSDTSKAHQNADTDMSFDALHHTLGVGETQAAKGNHRHTPETGLLVPATGWSIGPAGGLTLSKYSGMVTLTLYLYRTSDLPITVGTAYTYGVLPVGFRPSSLIPNFGSVGVVKAGGVRYATGAIFDLAGNCSIRAWLNATILGNSDDFIAVNVTFPHA